jgi:hypothetical protein
LKPFSSFTSLSSNINNRKFNTRSFEYCFNHSSSSHFSSKDIIDCWCVILGCNSIQSVEITLNSKQISSCLFTFVLTCDSQSKKTKTEDLTILHNSCQQKHCVGPTLS